MDIRLQTKPFDFEGKTYQLCCNMNVLADVQEAFGGDISAALDGPATVRSVLEFLTAMLNDYAEEQGWPMFTRKEVGRMIPLSRLNKEVRPLVMELVVNALKSDEPTEEKN